MQLWCQIDAVIVLPVYCHCEGLTQWPICPRLRDRRRRTKTTGTFLLIIFLRWLTYRLIHFSKYCSVAARSGKGRGAKEIGHNLVRGRPKFGHNLVRKRHKIGHCLKREWPSHFYARTTKNSVTSQHANETRSGHNFVGNRWQHGAQICKHFTSIFTSAAWKHKNRNYILY